MGNEHVDLAKKIEELQHRLGDRLVVHFAEHDENCSVVMVQGTMSEDIEVMNKAVKALGQYRDFLVELKGDASDALEKSFLKGTPSRAEVPEGTRSALSKEEEVVLQAKELRGAVPEEVQDLLVEDTKDG